VLYIVGISVISFVMKNRRAKEKDLQRQAAELKRLAEDIKRLEAAANPAEQGNNTLQEKKEQHFTLNKRYTIEKAAYKPLNINFITIPHNLIMCVYSFYAFIGIALVVLQNLRKVNYNLYALWCDKNEGMREGLDFWIYTFYLSKYVEYLDTVFLLLKAKPVIPPDNSQYFLHIYHHAITAAIVWVTLHYNFSTAWTGPLTNAFVHTMMYGYYFLAEMDKIDRSLGGKFITPIQLIQFMFCLASAIFETLQPNCGTHIGTILFLFVNYFIFFVFFVKIWIDKKRERRQARALRQKAAAATATKKEE